MALKKALQKAQKAKLLEWIAEGLRTDEINARARIFENPFVVTRQNVDYYRKKRGIEIEKLQQEAEHRALNTGLAIVSKRVELLKELAEVMVDDLMIKRKFWLDQQKGIGQGQNFQVVDYELFNVGEVQQLRGILDDIAREVGDRVQKQDITSKGEKLAGVDLTKLTDEELANLRDLISKTENPNPSGD